LTGRPWVTYSHELPITRRFWQRALGRPFAGDLRLIAPDLRVVAGAVVAGLGASLLPTFVVDDLLERGAVVELVAVSELVPSQQWYAITLSPDGGRLDVAEVVSALTEAGRLG
jgi:DNA-binding transcriptional LysR family regulator